MFDKMSEAAPARLTYAEYVALERAGETKHEYLDGQVRAMAGGTIEHGRLTSRFNYLVRVALAGRPCEAFSPDTKIRIEASNRTTYADVFVVCGALERSTTDPEAVVNPVVIVEGLSASTEAYDRGEKFRHYRRLASLREYVLVAQDQPLVEVWRRDGDAWRVEEYGPKDAARLKSLEAAISVAALYEDPLATSAS
jgi:Uma2 family endonuclease